MKPQFHPSLVNSPSGDPAVFVDFLFDRRAILFDLGDITSLPSRKILRISHVFISHTHMDHFIGFDRLLRVFLGRDKTIQMIGPPGFLDQVWHRLSSYTWNLVANYPTNFTIAAMEVHPDGKALRARFSCRNGFQGEGNELLNVPDGLLLDEENFQVRFIFLDHKIHSLAYSFEEKCHVNIMRNRLNEMGLPIGPWVSDFKKAVMMDEADAAPYRVWWREDGQIVEKWIPFGDLRSQAVQVVPGQKIVYVTDTAYNESNAEKIVEFARGADYLFIEAAFLREDTERAALKCHLTTEQAGVLAYLAGAVRVIPFHFSPKYSGMEEVLEWEVRAAISSGGL
jgi:ribonuclease Z